MNFITKHGGSDYHGTAYTYQRDKSFNSINYFNEREGLPKPEYRYSTLGGNLGGPVPVPKMNRGQREAVLLLLDRRHAAGRRQQCCGAS